jgi:hypothetical protein
VSRPLMTRISCPAFAIMREGSYFGLITDTTTTMGLVPIGGAIQADPTTISMIMADFEAPASSFETNAIDTLRFTVPAGKVNDVINWFEAFTKWRKPSMTVQLMTSLQKEAGVLTPAEVRSLKQEFLGFARLNAPTSLPVPEKHTLYLVQLFSVVAPKALKNRLSGAAILDDASRFRLVHYTDIQAGVTEVGHNQRVRIDPAAQALLMKPNRKIPRS